MTSSKKELELNAFSIQRYMTYKKFEKTLTIGGLYLTRLSTFSDDPTEGMREYYGENQKRMVDILNSKFPQGTQVSHEEAEKIARGGLDYEIGTHFIQSWYRSSGMSSEMWANYAKYKNNKDCIMIVSDVISLGAAIEYIPGMASQDVKYVEDKLTDKHGIFTKLKNPFEYEKEHRVALDLGELILFNPNILPELPYSGRAPDQDIDYIRQSRRHRGIVELTKFQCSSEKGIILKTDLTRLITHVCVPTDSSIEFRKELNQTLRRYGFNMECVPVDVLVRASCGEKEAETTI